MDTREFLSSLQLKMDATDTRYIKLRLCNTTQRVYLSTLRGWFGFHEEPTTETLSFREGWDRDIFWKKITGNPKAQNDALRARFISHPVLHIIQRALACTIFARGETLNRGNQIELMLIESMLHPTPDLPDLALLMVQHWIELQKSKRSGSKIKIGLFVHIIKTYLALDDFPGRGICSGPTSLNPTVCSFNISSKFTEVPLVIVTSMIGASPMALSAASHSLHLSTWMTTPLGSLPPHCLHLLIHDVRGMFLVLHLSQPRTQHLRAPTQLTPL